ncbi:MULTISPECIES: hypothetical protein [Bacillus cereus group]|nr:MULTISPECIES: hypothetical protein [Bacillus cereus group]
MGFWSGGYSKKETVIIVFLWILYLPFGLIGLFFEWAKRKITKN